MLTYDGHNCSGKLFTYNYIIKPFLDINECCPSSNVCEHACTNTPGSFYCTCKMGYYLLDNKHSCEGKI